MSSKIKVNQISNLNENGYITVVGNTGLDISSANSSLILPKGDESTRPSSPVEGAVRFNIENNFLEFWDGTEWVKSDGTSSGVGTPTTTSTIFNYTGALQTFTWPTHFEKISLTFILMGAGGGNGNSAVGWGGSGGWTEFTQTSGFRESYSILVGQAGSNSSGGSGTVVNSFGGGGDGGWMGGRAQYGGGGGGGSFVFDGTIATFTPTTSYHSQILAVAGGGGGPFFSASAQSGGNGGGSSGQDGLRGTSSGNGTGGTQTGPGANGPSYGSGTGQDAPSNHQGGVAYQSGYEYAGGGGGGGWFGGGCGGSCVSVCPGSSGNGAGAGGSGYINTTKGTGITQQGRLTTSEYYDTTVGGPTQNGRVIVIANYLV